jgi:hypothetical protein
MYFPALSDEDMKLPFYVTSAGGIKRILNVRESFLIINGFNV